jgi:hypothetical protein
MKYAVVMTPGGTIYLPIFTEINTDVIAILRLCCNNMRGCNIANTDQRDL